MVAGEMRLLVNWRELRADARRAQGGEIPPKPPVLRFRNGLALNMVAASHAGWDLLFREIFLDRCYQPTPDFVPLAGWTVIDLGANMGFFTCQAATSAPGVRVMSVEPLTPYRTVLEKNVAENRLEQVKIFPGAICGDRDQIIPLTVWYNTAGELKTGTPPADAVKVEVIQAKGWTLAEVFEAGKVERCDLMKVDIEGAEYDLFEKIQPSLWAKISRVVMEVHVSAKRKAPQIVSILEQQGFSVSLRHPESDTPMLWAVRR
jgi:FkbM family methyltransferase